MAFIRQLFDARKGSGEAPKEWEGGRKIHEPFTMEFEEELLRKYTAMKNEVKPRFNPRQSTNFASNNSDILVYDTFSKIDQDKEKDLMAICPEIKTIEEARFFLEATSYNLEEAEKLYNGEAPEEIKSLEVTLVLPNQDVKERFASSTLMWEICEAVYKVTQEAKELKITNADNMKEILMEEMSSMSFEQYGFRDTCVLMIEFI